MWAGFTIRSWSSKAAAMTDAATRRWRNSGYLAHGIVKPLERLRVGQVYIQLAAVEQALPDADKEMDDDELQPLVKRASELKRPKHCRILAIPIGAHEVIVDFRQHLVVADTPATEHIADDVNQQRPALHEEKLGSDVVVTIEQFLHHLAVVHLADVYHVKPALSHSLVPYSLQPLLRPQPLLGILNPHEFLMRNLLLFVCILQ